MSVIGVITVYKCDDCGKIKVVSNETDEAVFSAEWFTALTKEFCPDCKGKVSNQAAILAEEKRRDAFKALFVTTSSAQKEANHAVAH